MNKYPTTRFVFDRKNTATKNKKALIQVEVLFKQKKKYISTGVKVYKDQWSNKTHIIRRSDMYERNEDINAVKDSIDNYLRELRREKAPFSWENFNEAIISPPTRDSEGAEEEKETFIAYARRRINERTDITAGTRRNHMKVINSLEESQIITDFQELTRPNLLRYYEHLMAKKVKRIDSDGKATTKNMAQQTVASYMKCLKVYIHDALEHELIEKDPTAGMKIKHGESEPDRWLSEEEVRRIEEAVMPSGSLQRVKDRFLAQIYTGMAFSDLMDLDISKVEHAGGIDVIVGRRIKTGEPYTIAVLPEIRGILEKYAYKMPPITNEQYNLRLKVVAEIAGIKKKLASHWARRTFAVMMINRGVRAETLAQAMGHSDSRTTLEFYARMKKETVAAEMIAAMKQKPRT